MVTGGLVARAVPVQLFFFNTKCFRVKAVSVNKGPSHHLVLYSRHVTRVILSTFLAKLQKFYLEKETFELSGG